ncbi:MAG: helix-turn-helix domain-containing protein [Chloroflexia bacterium]|nr:helix-turn-helix domain-containing protein [Chloroflexia bacterium]MDQ3411587.1 helix-turn-helix domain-containing protein [Chloroflexota bacterium]
MTTAEVAALAGVHLITARKWIAAGRLPSVFIENRRYVPKRAIVRHYILLLQNPATRAATIERLQAVAAEAGVVQEGQAGGLSGPA